MAHAQKPDFLFPRNGRVHLNRWGRHFSRLLAVEVCASAWVMLDILCSEVAWEYWLPTPFTSFPFTCPPVLHRVPPGSERALPHTTFVPRALRSLSELPYKRRACQTSTPSTFTLGSVTCDPKQKRCLRNNIVVTVTMLLAGRSRGFGGERFASHLQNIQADYGITQPPIRCVKDKAVPL